MKAFSASQLSKFVECPTRWGHIYLEGNREPFARSAQAGSEVHALLEVASKDAPPDESKTWEGYPTGVMAGALWRATPADITKQEQEFNQSIDGLPFTGRIDFSSPTITGDYKSTSKVKYIKSPRTLGSDIQRLLYVEVLKPEKTLWLYSAWEDPTKVHPVEIVVDANKDRERFKLHVLSVAEQVSKIDAGTDPLSLPKHTAACKLYPKAGCPFKLKCFPHTATVGLGLHMNSILDKLRKEQDSAATFAANLAATVAEDMASERGMAIPGQSYTLEGARDIVSDNGVLLETNEQRIERKVGFPVFEDKQFPIETLYVDAIPMSQPYTLATVLISEAAQEVADDNHVLSAFLVDFGKGGHMVAAQFAHNIRKNPVTNMVLETRSAEGKAVLHTAMSLARNIVRGVF